MDVPTLIRDALGTLRVDQAELSRRLGVGQSTVSKWVSGTGKPDYESCLRLAKITGMAAVDVLRAAELDPALLPPAEPRRFTAIERDVLSRMERLQALADATEGIPDNFADVYLRKILDTAEGQVEATLALVRNLRHLQATPLTERADERLTTPEPSRNGDETDSPDRLPLPQPVSPSIVVSAHNVVVSSHMVDGSLPGRDHGRHNTPVSVH